MEGFVHSIQLNEAMRHDHPEYFADQMTNRPDRKIVVWIRLSNLRIVPSDVMDRLKRLLKGSHNMDLTQPESRTDMVRISGIPPANGFGPQQVEDIVRSYVENWSAAELAPER